jgi:hypothetical protein
MVGQGAVRLNLPGSQGCLEPCGRCRFYYLVRVGCEYRSSSVTAAHVIAIRRATLDTPLIPRYSKSSVLSLIPAVVTAAFDGRFTSRQLQANCQREVVPQAKVFST